MLMQMARRRCQPCVHARAQEFAASGVVGEDVVALLQQELLDRGIKLQVQALANDTVGTMEAAAYASECLRACLVCRLPCSHARVRPSCRVVMHTLGGIITRGSSHVQT